MNLNKSITPAKILLCGACALIELLSLSSISLAQEPWTTKAPMPTARFWFSCEVVNGKIYAIGGATAAGAPILKTVEEYDPVTDTWTTKQDMPTARYNMASAVVDGKIYIMGGGHSFNIGVVSSLPTLEVYDPATDTWDTTKTDMPTAREGVSGCVVDGIIYAVGGINYDYVALKIVEAYDPVTDTWTTKAPMPTGRWALSTPVVNGKIYAMGTGQAGKTVEEYDPLTNSWTTKASMPVGLGYFGTVVVDGIIYTMGGGTGSSTIPNARMFAYDPVTDEWSEKATMPTGRGQLGASFVNGKIYAIGGTPHYTIPPLSINEEYDPHLDLLPLIENVELDRGYVEPGTGTVCITTKIIDPTGIILMAKIKTPDQTPVDSLELFDDGNHNDGNADDSLYANVWPVSSAEEQQYYVDLKVTRVDMDTVINRISNMASFTTIGRIVYENHTFTGDDTIPNPGDQIRLELTLMNNSSVATATNIKAKLISLDTSFANVITTSSRSFGDIAAGESSKSSATYSIEISEECMVNTPTSIMAEITSDDYLFWRDTFSIMVEEPVNINNIIEPITRIYPNPSTDHVFIDFNQPLQGEILIEVLEYTGKPVLMDRIYGNNLYMHKMDFSKLKCGIYILRIINENKCVYKKIIKSL